MIDYANSFSTIFSWIPASAGMTSFFNALLGQEKMCCIVRHRYAARGRSNPRLRPSLREGALRTPATATPPPSGSALWLAVVA